MIDGALPRWTRVAFLLTALGVHAVSILFVLIGADGRIRTSADSQETEHLWRTWVPVLAGTSAVLLLPRRVTGDDLRRPETTPKAVWALGVQALVLVVCALAFVALLLAAGPAEPVYTVGKLLLLLVLPLALWRFTGFGREAGARAALRAVERPRARVAPLVAVAVWTAATLAIASTDHGFGYPAEFDPVTLVAIIVIGFLINAVLEELFYRRWAQTRFEVLVGPVGAILWASILWALWHVAIQGTGDLLTDIARVVANQGVTGIFLGLLWWRYRAMWPLLVVHGLVNAVPLFHIG
ncbi:CPBP family intramembrane metalloprotease [Nocardiopsis sp. N85]|uniref:CPBP family intramembrane glutamic endopeptidase n=1 Tax=Nocardiopsis sp. N85 TaxID=3029400 RepID=UPI00237F20B9|nr:CPBP family intramembrane glutamic endopeptidase [Nocardiopsis sp. N85]MDE3721681.1 CPBP family intramembrane metalloprotease [Nocardiopsis sp. N85]